MLTGAVTLAGGLLGAFAVFASQSSGVGVTPWWVPTSYLLSGVLGSLVWFALAGIVRRLDEVQKELTRRRS